MHTKYTEYVHILIILILSILLLYFNFQLLIANTWRYSWSLYIALYPTTLLNSPIIASWQFVDSLEFFLFLFSLPHSFCDFAWAFSKILNKVFNSPLPCSQSWKAFHLSSLRMMWAGSSHEKEIFTFVNFTPKDLNMWALGPVAVVSSGNLLGIQILDLIPDWIRSSEDKA